MRALLFILCLLSSSLAFARGTTVKVRCPEKCSVLLEGKAGRRLDDALWEFQDVEPGKRRVEVKGLLGRHLAAGHADIPKAPAVTLFVDHKGRLSVSRDKEEAAPASAAAQKKKGASPSVLHVRCHKPCVVAVDNVRKNSSNTQAVTVREVEPGSHQVEARFVLGATRRATIEVPPGSEVYLMASDAGVQVTNTRPMGK
jgi:hypothetical protein